jgi:hypothetical protein
LDLRHTIRLEGAPVVHIDLVTALGFACAGYGMGYFFVKRFVEGEGGGGEEAEDGGEG